METRREQILFAAADCFRKFGFHSASISRISPAAGMSPGHIYYYFTSKEAIIAAIVCRDLAGQIELMEMLRREGRSSSLVRDRIASAMRAQLNPEIAALKVEILAEAGRNLEIGKVVRDADSVIRHSLALAVEEVRRSAGFDDDPEGIAVLVEVLLTIYSGLSLRVIRNPSLDPGPLSERAGVLIHDALMGSVQAPNSAGGAGNDGGLVRKPGDQVKVLLKGQPT